MYYKYYVYKDNNTCYNKDNSIGLILDNSMSMYRIL